MYVLVKWGCLWDVWKRPAKRGSLPMWKCWTNGVVCGMCENVRQKGGIYQCVNVGQMGSFVGRFKTSVNLANLPTLPSGVPVSCVSVKNKSCCKRSIMVWNFIWGIVNMVRLEFGQMLKDFSELWKRLVRLLVNLARNRDNLKRPINSRIYQHENVGKFGSFVGQVKTSDNSANLPTFILMVV